MEKGLFGFIWRYSKTHQAVITLVTVAGFPFMYLALELPKIIVNDALGGKKDGDPFPRSILGVEDVEQLTYLLVLCAVLLVLLVFNGAFQMFLNTYKGVTSERLLRRLRYTLYERILRFPLSHFQKVSQGELTSMITAEVEPLSAFFADAVSLPLFMGGTMLVALAFMFVQNPIMGLVGVAIVPLQAWLIPKLQHKINLMAKERVVRIRQLSGRISEAVSGINDIHTHDTSAFSLADFTKHLSGIYKLRYEIYRKKAFLKFINNFLLKLTPLLFYSVGGWLMLAGKLDIGQLVAVLGAYGQLMQPWKELLRYYQRLADAVIKYEQVAEQFNPADMMSEDLMLSSRPEAIDPLKQPLMLQNVTVTDEDGMRALEGITFSAEPGSKSAIVAGGASRDKLAQVLTRLMNPTTGKVAVGDSDFSGMHEAVIGTRIGYAGPESYVFDGTIGYNALYGLKHVPVANGESGDINEVDQQEAIATGNSPHDADAEWIDYDLIGVNSHEELMDWWLETVQAVELDDVLYGRAMSMAVDPEKHSDLAQSIVSARNGVAKKLHDSPELADLVHLFDFDRYNTNASVGANLIFGEPVAEDFAIDKLGENEFVRSILDDRGLTERFCEIGQRTAVTLVDMFNDMSPDEPIFEQYSFVDEEALADLKHITAKVQREGADSLSEHDRNSLMALTFQLVVERHRLGFIDEEIQQQIVDARKAFHEQLPEDLASAIAIYDPETFNPRLSLRANLIMGRVNTARPQAEEKVDDLLAEVLKEMDLTKAVSLAAADFDVGIGGRRLPLSARQSIALMRSLIKRPNILVINEALGAHDRETRDRIRRNVCELLPNTTLIWIDSEMPDSAEFDQVLVLRNGRIEQRIADQEATDVAAPEAEAAEAGEPGILNAEAQALSQVPLFAEMEPSRLKLLAFTAERLTYDAGEELFHQGDTGDAAYVILKGEVDIVVGEGDSEIAVNQLGENELVGDMALLSTKPRSATVRASSKIEVLELKKDLFLELIEGSPHMAAQVARVMSDRLYTMTEQLQDAA